MLIAMMLLVLATGALWEVSPGYDFHNFNFSLSTQSAGIYRGPEAVLPLNDKLRLIADTLNYRLIIKDADSGRNLQIYDLSELNGQEMTKPPRVVDLALAGRGRIYAADIENMVIWRFNLGEEYNSPSLTVEGIIGSPGGIPGEYRQIDRIFADHQANLFVVDVSRSMTFVYSSSGNLITELPNVIDAVADSDGNLYYLIYTGDNRTRDLNVFSLKSLYTYSMVRIFSDGPVTAMSPLGFDQEGNLYLSLDNALDERILIIVRRRDQEVLLSRPRPISKNSLSMNVPVWLGPDSTLEWFEIDSASGTLKLIRRQFEFNQD